MMNMRNSSKYRKPPLRRTRDTFIDDINSEQNQRADLGKGRHLHIRRDKDKTRSLGISLYDIDFAIKSHIDDKIQLRFDENGDSIFVPTIYANSEKWASIQKDGFLKDKKGKTIVPLITFRRSSVTLKPEMKRNKVMNSNQVAYVLQKQKYNKHTPYDLWSTQFDKRTAYEYFMTPVPDYVDCTYDFIVWCEYQNQLNYIVEQFVYFGGQSFGEKNFFKFATNVDSFTMEDSNTTGQDRVVRASFQLMVHGYLLPKDVSTETTTKRLITANKITFTSEAFQGINSSQSPDYLQYSFNKGEFDRDPGGSPLGTINRIGTINTRNRFKSLNEDATYQLEQFQLRVQELVEKSINKSAGVYPQENH